MNCLFSFKIYSITYILFKLINTDNYGKEPKENLSLKFGIKKRDPTHKVFGGGRCPIIVVWGWRKEDECSFSGFSLSACIIFHFVHDLFYVVDHVGEYSANWILANLSMRIQEYKIYKISIPVFLHAFLSFLCFC